MTTRADFFTAVLRSRGWPVTPASLTALVTVATGEGSTARFNPIDTILYLPGATAFNSFGPGNRYHVWNYPSLQVGIEATVRTIDGWPLVVNAFAVGETAAEILAAYDASDGVGNDYYSNLLSYVQANYARLAAVTIAGSSEDPEPEEDDLPFIFEAPDGGQYVCAGPVVQHLDLADYKAYLALGVKNYGAELPASTVALLVAQA